MLPWDSDFLRSSPLPSFRFFHQNDSQKGEMHPNPMNISSREFASDLPHIRFFFSPMNLTVVECGGKTNPWKLGTKLKGTKLFTQNPQEIPVASECELLHFKIDRSATFF